jgi:hypothetical protein
MASSLDLEKLKGPTAKTAGTCTAVNTGRAQVAGVEATTADVEQPVYNRIGLLATAWWDHNRLS